MYQWNLVLVHHFPYFSLSHLSPHPSVQLRTCDLHIISPPASPPRKSRSEGSNYTLHAPFTFHRDALFCSDGAEERGWPLAASPRPSRGARGPGGPSWPSRVGTVHREAGAEGARKHAPARPPLPPNRAEGGTPSASNAISLQLSRAWESSLGAPLQNVACQLRVGSSSRRQRSEKVLHFSVSPNFQKLVFSPKMEKNLPLQFCHLLLWGFLNLNIFSSLSSPLYMSLVCWGFFRNSDVACCQVIEWQLFTWS